MAWVAGTDGCRRGWVRIAREIGTTRMDVAVVTTPEALLVQPPVPEVLGIDIPIGLRDAGARTCDELARELLGPSRMHSVFRAPNRPLLLHTSDYHAANEFALQIGVARVSIQCHGLFKKIEAVDRWLAERPDVRHRVREVHPEVSFSAWNGGVPMRWRKKDANGREERSALVSREFGPNAFMDARRRCHGSGAAADDILDAFAALWTATRIARCEAVSLPVDPPRDSAGLPMQIVY